MSCDCFVLPYLVLTTVEFIKTLSFGFGFGFESGLGFGVRVRVRVRIRARVSVRMRVWCFDTNRCVTSVWR